MLEGDAAAKASIRAPGQRVTSALTVAETSRAVLRARISGRITVQQERAAILTLQRFTRRCHIVTVTEAILAHAGRPFPIDPIRTLDAIHLATAQALGEPPALVTIVTRDVRVRDNANALGHPVE
jgi:predicted nucleic acid-binding protein